MQDTRVIVIGAGIGGLSAALALQKHGVRVRVYERAAEIREVGAGLIVTANARRALHALGVDEALFAMSSCVSTMYNCRYDTGEIFREHRNADIQAKYGFATLQVHRADLHKVLLDAVVANDPTALRASHVFQDLTQDDQGVTARFTNGVEDRADAMIGADGNASAVRSFLFPGVATEFNGQVAFRALIPPHVVPRRVHDLGQAIYPGPGRYLLHYPLRGGKIMNLIGCGQAKSWEDEGWAIPATNDEFLNNYGDFAPHLLDLIQAIPDGALFKWGLRDREPLPMWVKGRVAILGDAAHPMTPFLGQGACLAVEDSMLLGRAFGVAASAPEALARYDAARRERGNSVQLMSRDEGLALQDPTRKRRQAIDRGLLDYDPVAVPV
ncbi:MAG: FAD-dependent monooxygenase [Rhodobacter sp.]|nr:FAD-dependent monooxygenase [Paracoccaceae bacterium]MCC0075280.1 FAD-dependent monooxygenase [Rhodobacter sp.]